MKKALSVVGGFVVVGTPVLTVGFASIALAAMQIMARSSHSRDLHFVVGWVFDASFLFVAFPALVGSIAATRTLRRFEADAPTVSAKLPA